MVKTKIKNLLLFSIKELQKEKILPQFPLPSFEVGPTQSPEFGDYFTNICFPLSKILNLSPIKVGELLVGRLSQKNFFEKIEIKEPGFLNFFLSKKLLFKELFQILIQGAKYGSFQIGRNKKVNLEFISANPTGPLHIGNGRGAFFGDCLAKVLQKAGYLVEKEYFINDAKYNSQIKTLGRTALGKDKTYLTPYLEKKLKKLQRKLKKIISEKEAGFLVAQEIQKDIKKFIEKKLKIKFDNWISEEKLFREGRIEKVLNYLKKQGLVFEKDKALWLRISKFGAPKDEVIVRSDGEPTYFLSDIAYHHYKFERKFQKIINIWGADHQGHVPKIKAIAKIFNYKGELEILLSQLVSLKGGAKLSKRKGKIITLESLIDEVGQDVARFFYLQKSLQAPLEFDLDLAKSQSQKNPVFYIQYALVRIYSILRKNKTKLRNIKFSYLKELVNEKELRLIKSLIKFPEIVEECASDYQLHRLTFYALEIAKNFHSFYDFCPVLKEKREKKIARLALILATKTILEDTLRLMGISTPKKM